MFEGQIEGGTEVTGRGRRGRRRIQLMDDLKTSRYWKLKEETLDKNSLWNRLWTCHKRLHGGSGSGGESDDGDDDVGGGGGHVCTLCGASPSSCAPSSKRCNGNSVIRK